jgi:hypothetical protein
LFFGGKLRTGGSQNDREKQVEKRGQKRGQKRSKKGGKNRS